MLRAFVSKFARFQCRNLRCQRNSRQTIATKSIFSSNSNEKHSFSPRAIVFFAFVRIKSIYWILKVELSRKNNESPISSIGSPVAIIQVPESMILFSNFETKPNGVCNWTPRLIYVRSLFIYGRSWMSKVLLCWTNTYRIVRRYVDIRKSNVEWTFCRIRIRIRRN